MRQWFIESSWAGNCKKLIYSLMQHWFGFDKWHIVPINHRPYALEIYRTLNYYIRKSILCSHAPIIEIGCGLGDVIGSLRWHYGKYGFDFSADVLKAAKIIHPSVKFMEGSFFSIKIDKRISCLIMINFIHAISYEMLKQYIEHILRNNSIEMFVFDTFRNNEGTEYRYSHDGKYLFDGKYKLFKRSPGFVASNGARRYIEYWKAT